MGNLKSKFQDLKSAIIGVSSAKIDLKLDKAVKDIVAYKSQSGRNSYINLIKSLISKTADVNISTGSGGIFGQGANPGTFGQGSRLSRYRAYEAIVSNINYCYRALSVLVDNILSPDDITKISLEVNPETFLEDEILSKSKSKLIQEMISEIKLEEKLKLIIESTLKFGDFFCEIGDEKTALTSRSILSESSYDQYIGNQFKSGIKEELICSYGKDKKRSIIIDYSSFFESKTSKEKNEDNIQSINLILHEPKFIVKLQSSIFPICFGYLIFPQISLLPSSAIEDDSINNICSSILKSLSKKIPQTKELVDDKDLKDIIASMVNQTDPSKAMSIRYVSPDKMEHFQIPSTKYYPYGESIFDSCQFTAKVFIALQTALAIQRISRSTEKRKIEVEVGLPRDAKKAIENLKEEFKKRKITLDSFGSVDTIPSQLTTFEDIYVPTKDGKPYINISTFTEGNVDIRSKVDELKFLRDEMVAGFGVPPALIGIEENSVVKATLSEENILFARAIISHQKYLTHQINSLIEKILVITKPEEALTLLDNVNINLPTPKSLQFERESKYISDLANLVETLERIGIPKEYSKKKYLTQIDWTEVEKYEIDEKIEKSLDPDKKKEDEEMGRMSNGGF